MGIAQTAARGVVVVAAGNVLLSIVSFATSVVLARLLLPEHFGIIALASFFFLLFARLREIGFDHGLINTKELTQNVVSTHFCLHLGIAGLIVVLSILSTPLLWRIYGPDIALIVLVLGLTGVFTELSVTCTLLLDKEMKFKESAMIGAATSVLTQLGMVALALMGFGLWSLVLGGIPAQLFNLVAVWRLAPIRPTLRFDLSTGKWFMRFGPWWHSLLSSTASLIIGWLDNFLVGTFVGTASLGFYSRAYNWSSLPTSTIVGIVGKVAYPTYAKLQDDRDRLSEAYSLVLALVVRLSAPITLFAALTIDRWTVLLIGEKWLPMVPIFQIFFVYMFSRSIFDDGAHLLLAKGDMRAYNNIRIGQAVSFLLALPAATYLFGPVGTAGAVSLVTGLSVLVLYRRLRAHVDLGYMQIFRGPAVASLVAFLSTAALLAALSERDLVFTVFACSSFFGIVYMAVLALLEGRSLVSRASYLYALIRG